MSEGRDFITGAGPGPHRVRVLKLGGRVSVEVNNQISVRWTDDGQTRGPVLQSGLIGLRQMSHSQRFSYTHFKVWAVKGK